MSGGARHRDSLRKRGLRWAYRAALSLHTALTARRRGGAPRLWYAGARSGDVGGTLVKLQRLMAQFPERRFDYNIAYLLSNAPYLSAGALARLRRRNVPIVLNQNGVFYPGWFDGDWRAMNARMALGYHAADHVFWQSAFCRRAAERFLGARHGHGEILFNAVDTRHFAPRAGTRDNSAAVFLMTGKFDRHRGYRLEAAIDGLARARSGGLEARLRIAGRVEDQLRAAIDGRIAAARLDGAVDFDGAYTQCQAPAIYADADVYLALGYNDPCPNAVIEALSCGLPVLYGASGGTPELVGDDAGIGLPIDESWEETLAPTAQAIAEGMAAILSGRDARALAARRRACSTFDIEAWLARHDAVFRNLLEAGR